MTQRILSWLLLTFVTLLCTACTYAPFPCCNNYAYVNSYVCNTSTTDRDITEAVQVRIANDAGLDNLGIRVFTYERTVTLKGHVENPTQRRIAIQIARCVPGVKRVISKLVIKSYDNT